MKSHQILTNSNVTLLKSKQRLKPNKLTPKKNKIIDQIKLLNC